MRVIGLLILLGLAGCASQADVDSWRGATYSELVMVYGTPAATTDLGQGRKAVEFEFAPYQSAYHCKAWFIIDEYQQVIDGRMKGNIGGCNNLIQNRPAALN